MHNELPQNGISGNLPPTLIRPGNLLITRLHRHLWIYLRFGGRPPHSTEQREQDENSPNELVGQSVLGVCVWIEP